MPTYQAPGIYVEEVPSALAPIAGVSTSTAGFIGQANQNAVAENEPQLITNWQQFTTKFGDFSTDNQNLAHAVYGFFNNGGSRCYVMRVTNTANITAALLNQKFAAIDEISIVAAPGVTDKATQDVVIDHCETTKDRFAILDGQESPSDLNSSTVNGQVKNSTYAALYFPWIQVFDPVEAKKPDSNGLIYVPPSGHIAGIYARVDSARGVHKAPANEVIRGALGLKYRLSRADQAGLNPSGINVIRQFNGNITVWGARTLADTSTHAEWKYISVRRLFIYLAESIDRGTQWVVFEPNGPALWAKIRRNVTAFLTNVWRSGALFGLTPQQAFYVRCDESNNPQSERELGKVVIEIGVAVVEPAEFVIFRLSQWAGPSQG